MQLYDIQCALALRQTRETFRVLLGARTQQKAAMRRDGKQSAAVFADLVQPIQCGGSVCQRSQVLDLEILLKLRRRVKDRKILHPKHDAMGGQNHQSDRKSTRLNSSHLGISY